MIALYKSQGPAIAKRWRLLPILFFFLSISPSCKKFVEIAPPRTDLVRTTVFSDDASANAAMLDIYSKIAFSGFASGNLLSITFLGSLSSDETINYNLAFSELQQFNDNSLLVSNSIIDALWSDFYSIIYKANAIIEGLNLSTGVSESLERQLMGEAKTIRAFCHFYLVNIFGDVPFVSTTDYNANSIIARTSQQEVFNHIILDLKEAATLLPEDYSHFNSERVRINKSAASSLLARAYLFTADWANAEDAATEVINNSSLYSLVPDLNDVFLRNSSESIWQLHTTTNYPSDLLTFINFGFPRNAALRDQFVNSFEASDQRRTQWIGSTVFGSDTYFFASKYKLVPMTQYSTVIRLAELYLIRAEARANQNKLTGANSAESDINMIRARAGLGNTPAITQTEFFAAIEQERHAELFTEWGHRWLDLKRTGRINAVLGPIKGSNWQSTDALYPIPESQVLISPITQNPGY